MDVAQEDIDRRVTEAKGLLAGAERYGERFNERYCGRSWQLRKAGEDEDRRGLGEKKGDGPAPPL
jgi:hypothetical protein